MLAFFGGAAAYSKDGHMAVQVIIDRLPRGYREPIGVFGDFAVLAMAISSIWYFTGTVLARANQHTSVLGLPETVASVPLLAGMLLFAIFAALRVARARATACLIGLGGVVVAVGVLVACRFATDAALIGPVGFWFAAGAAIVLILLGVPLGFGLAIASLAYTFANGTTPMPAVVSTMQDSMLENFVLVALPIFVLAGAVMTTGGLSAPLTRFLSSILGGFRGGLLQVAIVGMYLFSGLSGSKLADVTAIGGTMRDSFDREGYDSAEVASVLASAAAMGETVPPSIAMIVLGSLTTSISIVALFEAGLIPAATVAAALMVIAYIRGGRQVVTPGDHRARHVLTLAIKASPALLFPIILLVGVIGGVATPTEVSSFAVVYGLLIAFALYRTTTVREVWHLMVESAVMSGMLLFIVAAAFTFSWSLAIANVPQNIAQMLGQAGASPLPFLLLTAAVIIVMGAFLEGLPAIVIFAPLLFPVAIKLGISPLHFAIVLLISMGIGAFSPPIGVGSYVACTAAGARLDRMLKVMPAYFCALLVGLLAIIALPWLTLALPTALRH